MSWLEEDQDENIQVEEGIHSEELGVFTGTLGIIARDIAEQKEFLTFVWKELEVTRVEFIGVIADEMNLIAELLVAQKDKSDLRLVTDYTVRLQKSDGRIRTAVALEGYFVCDLKMLEALPGLLKS